MVKLCTCCGSHMVIQNDHVIAVTKGGKRTVPACQRCNLSKSNKPLMKWLRDLKQMDPYRWGRVEEHNYRKRSDIARKVQKVRDEGI